MAMKIMINMMIVATIVIMIVVMCGRTGFRVYSHPDTLKIWFAFALLAAIYENLVYLENRHESSRPKTLTAFIKQYFQVQQDIRRISINAK